MKENQHRLYGLLDGLDWSTAPVHTTIDHGHGRTERRTIQVLPAPADVGFPGAAQVFLIERYVTDRATGQHSAVAVLGVTSLTAQQASPAPIADYVRGHWGIENRLHWVRDVTYGEDASRVAPAPHPASWPGCATSPSARYAWPDTATSPEPNATWPATPPAH